MLSEVLIKDVLDEAMSLGADFAEIYVEQTESQSIDMIGGKVDKANRGQDYGVGIRLFQGTNSVYGYTNDSSRENLLKTAREIASALVGEVITKPINLTRHNIVNQHIIQTDLNDVPASRRIDKMRQVSEAIKNYHESISQSAVGLSEKKQHVLIANTEGTLVEDTRVYTRLFVRAVASNGQEMQTGSHGPGAHQGFEFIENLDLNFYATDAARQAVTMLNADLCPSGKMPVVIDNGFGGVIFHEACGHGLEASSVSKGLSVFSNKLGEQIANPIVTAIDDGTIPNAWGSLNVDDEGTPTQRKVLIENGILKSYMIDKLNGRRMNMASTGSGRRQNYRFAPTSRMTNTFIAEGPNTREEIIANTEYGLYAKSMGGGSVNPATGDFNFAVNEGYIIRNGKITEPVRGATLIGNGPAILHQIDMVGENLDRAQGMCGAASGSIPTDVGQPALRVKEITVGGAKGE
ncbi:MAG: TldD/PmbA family protein [Turicibacter sp.]|nr:TldD/PmbA family protein [Turicibacter sp.]